MPATIYPRKLVGERIKDLLDYAMKRYPTPFTAADAAAVLNCTPEVAAAALWPTQADNTATLHSLLDGGHIVLLRRRKGQVMKGYRDGMAYLYWLEIKEVTP